jgi:hypothetical protein
MEVNRRCEHVMERYTCVAAEVGILDEAHDKHGIRPPMKSSLFRIFMTRHMLGYTPEASVLRFPSGGLGRNH